MPNRLPQIRDFMIAFKAILLLVWALFTGYTLTLKPLEKPGIITLIEKTIELDLEGIDTYAFKLFSLMGVWPLVYACLLFIDRRMQKVPA